MTDAAVSARFAESDFRLGRVLSRSISVFSRRFMTFFIIAALAYLPIFLVGLWFPNFVPDTGLRQSVNPAQVLLFVFGFFVLMIVLNVLSQAMIVHAAFQDMRGRPVSLVGSVKVGLRRFLPLV